ncbi:hypothetical protein GE253_05100 [Niveispirillum sp. SYP-B3756]|uniref:hypothetical protein n=1 Tax=Niveispirillum sp. SYP-B3756 TaxID=2662178 RepID=UPI00129128C6|nr:hypothetical protein [Niveispirillum sp. SYP-B3756]MQP64720.1 hypothetical protein [Niveispirillum sp. SYP-B3756]
MALTNDRDTVERRAPTIRDFGLAGGAVIHAGALAVLKDGWVRPGFTGTGLVAAGRAESRVDNSGGADGDRRVKVKAGTFRFDSATAPAADAITAADIGKVAYIVDDHTVARTDGAGTRSPAGLIWDVDASGVWVRIG